MLETSVFRFLTLGKISDKKLFSKKIGVYEIIQKNFPIFHYF